MEVGLIHYMSASRISVAFPFHIAGVHPLGFPSCQREREREQPREGERKREQPRERERERETQRERERERTREKERA